MLYEPKTGRVSPLVLRDALLDYVLEKHTPHTVPLWEYYGPPRNLFMPLDHEKLLIQVYGGSDQTRRFFYQILLAMETLQLSFKEFYIRDGWDRFLKVRDEILRENRCMLFFKVIAWLSLDGQEKVEEALPQMRGLNLTYGLVAQYPEPILHTASCFACFERQSYLRVFSEERLREMEAQVEDLVAENAMSTDEPSPNLSNPYEYEEEHPEPVFSRAPVVVKDLSVPKLLEHIERQKLTGQLVDIIKRLMELSCPIRGHAKRFLDYLGQLFSPD